MKKALITGITGQEGDILIALSGSGNSENIIKAIETAKGIGIKTFSGAGFVDYVLMNKSSLSPFLLWLRTGKIGGC